MSRPRIYYTTQTWGPEDTEDTVRQLTKITVPFATSTSSLDITVVHFFSRDKKLTRFLLLIQIPTQQQSQRLFLGSSLNLSLLLHDTKHVLSTVSIHPMSTLHGSSRYRVRRLDRLLRLYFDSNQSTTVLAVVCVRNGRALLRQVVYSRLSCFNNVGILTVEQENATTTRSRP
jgi:hypothetical protein